MKRAPTAPSLLLVLLLLVVGPAACKSSSDSDANGAGSGASGGTTTTSSGTSTGSGGSGTGAGPSGGSGGAVDPGAVTRVTDWIGQLPYGQQDLSPTERTEIVDAIIRSCIQFGPPGADWQTYCQAILVGAILKESSYDPTSLVSDGYGTRAVPTGTANDPTVGLLQIRFSSTVNDYNSYGPLASMAAIGCNFPDFGHAAESGDSDFWAVTGPTQNMGFMQSIPCNIGLASWYYFLNATGNGGPSAVYAYQYCQGQGVAGNVVIGLLSHLLGPSGAHPPDPSNAYVTFIKGWFTTFLGDITPDPFGVSLDPSTFRYCR